MKFPVPSPARARVSFRNFWVLASLSAGAAVASDDSLLGLAGAYRAEVLIIYAGLVLYPFTPLLAADGLPGGRPAPGDRLLKARARCFAGALGVYLGCAVLVGLVGGALVRGREGASVAASLGEVLTGAETRVLVAVLALACLLLPGAFFGGFGPGRRTDP